MLWTGIREKGNSGGRNDRILWLWGRRRREGRWSALWFQQLVVDGTIRWELSITGQGGKELLPLGRIWCSLPCGKCKRKAVSFNILRESIASLRKCPLKFFCLDNYKVMHYTKKENLWPWFPSTLVIEVLFCFFPCFSFLLCWLVCLDGLVSS